MSTTQQHTFWADYYRQSQMRLARKVQAPTRTYMHTSLSRFSPDEDERLRSLLRQGASAGDIARRMERPKNSVMGRAELLGFVFCQTLGRWVEK